MKCINTVVLAFMFSVFSFQNTWAADDVIRIGFNLPMTGMFELVGNHAKNAAELVRKDIEAAGGIDVGGKKYKVEFLYGDNGSEPSKASSLAVKQVTNEKVHGVIGPLSSRQAIPVGQMVQAFSTPMISPWSTSPLTTKDRPFVFRSGFIYTMQSPVITQFVASEFEATKGAILYDIVSAYPRGMAISVKEYFEKENGEGSIVAFEEFRTGDEDFTKQLARIKESGAQFIFTPQHFNEVPVIVRQAKKMGLDLPIVGSNSWAGGDLIGECGVDCEGLFFTGNYAPGNAKGLNKTFVDTFKKTYGDYPDEPAALTWDAVRAFVEAVKKSGKLTGSLLMDRKKIKDSLVALKGFDGAAGVMNFNAAGDPDKCAVVIKIESGIFSFYDSVCP